MKKAVLFFGGNSDERLVSVATAQNLARQFPFDSRWFFNTAGEIFDVSITDLTSHQNPFQNPFLPKGKRIAQNLHEALILLTESAVFMGFHGTEGESGAIQSILEQFQIPFSGSDSKASHQSFEKALAKEAVKKAGISVAKELLLSPKKAKTEIANLNKFLTDKKKIVCKPVANGSSIGLFIISNEDQLSAAVKEIDKSNCAYLVEEFIAGRELTVGVLEKEGRVFALSTTEILLNQGRAFDYEGKYLGLGSNEITPAKLTVAEAALAMKMAEEAHRCLGCSGYSRTDMILSQSGELYFLETNTLPGLTAASLYPQQLAVQGIKMHDFVELQLEIAEIRAEGDGSKKKPESDPPLMS